MRKARLWRRASVNPGNPFNQVNQGSDNKQNHPRQTPHPQGFGRKNASANGTPSSMLLPTFDKSLKFSIFIVNERALPKN
jgi:hypothetical protein